MQFHHKRVLEITKKSGHKFKLYLIPVYFGNIQRYPITNREFRCQITNLLNFDSLLYKYEISPPIVCRTPPRSWAMNFNQSLFQFILVTDKGIKCPTMEDHRYRLNYLLLHSSQSSQTTLDCTARLLEVSGTSRDSN